MDTASEADEEAKQRLVLKVCLAEIERSRPFLIALIGDRYGWVPPLERMQAAAQEAGHKVDLTGKSVTALEIEYGVLDSADRRGRSRFYFRAPLPYERMDPKTAAGYSERHTGKKDAPAHQARLCPQGPYQKGAARALVRLLGPGRWGYSPGPGGDCPPRGAVSEGCRPSFRHLHRGFPGALRSIAGRGIGAPDHWGSRRRHVARHPAPRRPRGDAGL